MLPDKLDRVAEYSYDLLTTGGKCRLKRSVRRRYDKNGAGGLQRRQRYLMRKRKRTADELAELYLLDIAITSTQAGDAR